MNIFKVLDTEYRKCCLDLSRVEVDTEEYYVVKKRLSILSKVLVVLKSYSWIKREEPRKKLKYFMENEYDYSKLAMKFNISKESAYVLISRLSKQFNEVIRVNSVEELLDANFDIENIKVKGGSIVNIFISDIREQLEVRENKDIDVLECKSELQTLRNLTTTIIHNRVKRLDKDKVSHILYLLQTDSVEYALEKELVWGYINGNIKKIEELESKLKDL